MAEQLLPGTDEPALPMLPHKADGAAPLFAVTPRPGLNETR